MTEAIAPLKILIYNYAQPGEGEGGGVSIYQRNLASALTGLGHSVILLSSGMRYSIRGSHVSLRRMDDEKYLRADLVNSPVVAPALATFYDLASYYTSEGLDHLPELLRKEFGDIDIFHFQNVEGLTYRVFTGIRSSFPDARLIYSVHNYNLICAQVHLWFQDQDVCVNYQNGYNCTRCLINEERRPHHQTVRPFEVLITSQLGLPRTHLAVRVTRRLLRIAVQKTEIIVKRGFRLKEGRSSLTLDPNVYRIFRQRNVELCNQVFDQVLAVSKRTSDILSAYGVRPSRMAVSYIGTSHKSAFLKAKKIESFEVLHLGYFGYARRDKGFFFFLDALESLPANIASQVELTVAASIKSAKVLTRLKTLRSRLRSVNYYNGFTHATLDRIIAPVNLGVVPVLWEDNLPQVAIEIVSRGIPILTSDRGGAGEIASNPDFSFKAGDVLSFNERLQSIVTGDLSLKAFWDSSIRIFSMEEHVADLMHFYVPEPSSLEQVP